MNLLYPSPPIDPLDQWILTVTSRIDLRAPSSSVWNQINRKLWPWWNSLAKIHLYCPPIYMVVLSLHHIPSIIQCKFYFAMIIISFFSFSYEFFNFYWNFRLKIRNHNECCKDSPTPDDAMFRQLALVYAQNHPAMKTGRNCEEVFPNGITNGANWYDLNNLNDQ